MNILFLSQIVPYPPHGGVLQRGYNIIREISKYNDVHLLAFIHPDVLNSCEKIEESKKHLLQYCKTVQFFELWPKKSIFHKYLAFASGFIYPLPFSALAHRSSSFRKGMNKIITSKNIDVIHYDTIGLAPYLNSRLNIPTILTHHNIESELMSRRAKHESNILSKFYVRLQAIRLCKYEAEQSPLFELNVVMSEADHLILKKLSPNVKTVVVPNGVDTDYFKLNNIAEEKAIIYTGGMNMFANKDAVMHLIKDIWPQIKKSVPEAIFHVIGQDPPIELIEISKNTDSGIMVHGFVDDIRPFVGKSAVYVVPLRVGGGTRLKVLDSLSQGKAIVSTSVGCEGIDVTDRLNIHIEDDDSQFSTRVIELLNDSEKRLKLGAEARKLAEEKYSWTSIGRILQDSYENISRKVNK